MNIHAQRIKDLQHMLKQDKLDGLLMGRTLEIGFFSGFHLDDCAMLVTRSGAWVFMPRMFVEQFRATTDCAAAVACDGSAADGALARVKELKLKRAAFEPDAETYPRGTAWRKGGVLEHPGLTGALRAVKQGSEIETLRRSCRIAAKAFGLVKPFIKTGCTELSVYRRLEDIMQDMGAKGPSFNLIVGFGPDSAMPHHETSGRRLKNNEAVLIDYGCVYEHYCSDITRTYFHGKPTEEFKKVYAIVAASHKAGLAKVRAGVKARDVDAACRAVIADAGYGQYFTHGTGHGVGLEIHEFPRVNTRSEAVLGAGMAITVEPGIYLHGKFGVRIEDSVLVTKTGCEILTRTA
ncbi:MAG TPA: aminopeptidase P family protein [Elusimicrobiales bacterium]|nr:aminopeptidase P family protein [Elusimicrobiales bacterium]